MRGAEAKNTRTTAGTGVRKKRILALARNLFWQKGYHSVSMRDLAHAYGCQPANLYNYFKTKESILFEVLLEEMEQIIQPIAHIEAEEDGDPVEQLRLIIFGHLNVTLSYRRSAKTLFDVALGSLSPRDRKVIVSMRDTYDRIIRKVIKRGQERGLFVSCDEKVAGFMIASMITRTRIWFHPGKGLTVAELAQFIFRFTLRAIGAREEVERAVASGNTAGRDAKRIRHLKDTAADSQRFNFPASA
ncbi:MAG: TetR family transcriptional regulator [Thermodesulfobacteriota bacterium]